MSENCNFEKAIEKLSPQQQKIVAQILENLEGGQLVRHQFVKKINTSVRRFIKIFSG
jgi:hypothetical protein